MLDDGSVWCWGRNDWGQLGTDLVTRKYHYNPVRLPGVTGATQLGAGTWYSCALVAGGKVECWGLPPPTDFTSGIQSPTFVPGLSGVVSLAAGGELGIDTGEEHACALLGDGSVECWGANNHGQLGDGTTTSRTTPAPVPGLSGVLAVAAGGAHTCALMADYSIECWGDNSHGQLGDGTTADVVATPQPVLSSELFNTVACGASHTCARTSSGSLFCWGANSEDQLGDGTTTERHVPTQVVSSGVREVAAFDYQTCATYSGDGSVYCWGFPLGRDVVDTPTPVGVTYAQAVAVGGGHVCAIVNYGELECWGWNASGQLGDGTWDSGPAPRPVVWP